MKKTSNDFKGWDSIFAVKLRTLLEKEKITNIALANELKVSGETVSQYAVGKILPGIDKLMQIAKFFDVNTDYLLGLASLPKTNINWDEMNLALSFPKAAREKFTELNNLAYPKTSTENLQKRCRREVLAFLLENVEVLDLLFDYLSIDIDDYFKNKDVEQNTMALCIPKKEGDVTNYSPIAEKLSLEDLLSLRLLKIQKALIELRINGKLSNSKVEENK